MKRLAILGSTGSIGRQVLDVVRRYPDRFSVAALTAHTGADLLCAQAAEFKPSFVGLTGSTQAIDCAVPVAYGAEALEEAATRDDVDTVVVSVVGMCGLKAVLAAIRAGKTIALANKESLVAGGSLVMDAAKAAGVDILPIDSEHSAVWQCLSFGKRFQKIILTASGGPFFGRQRDSLKNITPEEAVKHPNWNMGAKISVDSATMMNKGLEIIEAAHLFHTDRIEYVIHRESVIHSMVAFEDGTIAAQMSPPTMDIPIQLALTYPERLPSGTPTFDFSKPLTFHAPDEKNFPMPALARESLRIGGNAPCALNAANEAAVGLFLKHKIGFCDIYEIVKGVLSTLSVIEKPTLQDILNTYDEIVGKLMRDYR